MHNSNKQVHNDPDRFIAEDVLVLVLYNCPKRPSYKFQRQVCKFLLDQKYSWTRGMQQWGWFGLIHTQDVLLISISQYHKSGCWHVFPKVRLFWYANKYYKKIRLMIYTCKLKTELLLLLWYILRGLSSSKGLIGGLSSVVQKKQDNRKERKTKRKKKVKKKEKKNSRENREGKVKTDKKKERQMHQFRTES